MGRVLIQPTRPLHRSSVQHDVTSRARTGSQHSVLSLLCPHINLIEDIAIPYTLNPPEAPFTSRLRRDASSVLRLTLACWCMLRRLLAGERPAVLLAVALVSFMLRMLLWTPASRSPAVDSGAQSDNSGLRVQGSSLCYLQCIGVIFKKGVWHGSCYRI